jgi:hypothetical protein
MRVPVAVGQTELESALHRILGNSFDLLSLDWPLQAPCRPDR